jgi:hypothetical protein
MTFFGDIRLGESIDVKFCTVNTSGVPTTLAGTPVVAAYPGNSTTEITAGITLTVDFDARTGLNNVRVVATGGNGYATATNYALVITTGTVGGTSVVGYVIGTFSIENRSALMPTTAARTLDVSAGGEGGVDWANVGTPGSTVSLSATTVGTATTVTTVNGLAANAITAASIATGAVDADALASDAVTEIRSVASGTADSGTTTTMVDAARTEADTDYWKGCWILFTSGTIAGQARLITGFNAATDTITFAPATTQAVGTQTYEILPAGGVDLRLWLGSAPNSLVIGRVDASVGVAQAGAISASSFAANAVDAAALAADAVAEIAGGVWNEDATAHQTIGTFGQAIGDPVADTNTIYKAVVTDAAGATVGVDVVAVKTETASIQADTDNIQTRIPAALVGGRMDSDIGAISTDSVAADNAESFFDGTGYAGTGNTIPNVTTVATATNVTTVNGLAANVITAASMAVDAGAEIADAVWDEAVSGHSTAGTYGEHHFTVYSGQVTGAATTTTLIDSGLTAADTDHYKGRIIIFIDGALKYQATDVTGFTPGTDTLTFTALTQAPTAGPGGSRYVMV